MSPVLQTIVSLGLAILGYLARHYNVAGLHAPSKPADPATPPAPVSPATPSNPLVDKVWSKIDGHILTDLEVAADNAARAILGKDPVPPPK